MDRGRRSFLQRFGLAGVAGAAALSPLPYTQLDDRPIDRSLDRDVNLRERATDDPQPKQDYGLQIEVDTYRPNPDLERISWDGNVTDRSGTTSLYIRGWIDEEVYGMQNEAARAVFARELAECTLITRERMGRVMAAMRRGQLEAKAKAAAGGVEVTRG